VRVFLPLGAGQVDQVELRCADVHQLVDGLLGFQLHGEDRVRPGGLAVHGRGGDAPVTPAHGQHLRRRQHGTDNSAGGEGISLAAFCKA